MVRAAREPVVSAAVKSMSPEVEEMRALSNHRFPQISPLVVDAYTWSDSSVCKISIPLVEEKSLV